LRPTFGIVSLPERRPEEDRLPPISDHLIRAYLRLTGFRSHRISTSVGSIHALDARGSGALPPVVLLHGFAASCTSFLPILKRVRSQVSRVLIPDLPGHGFSEIPRDGINVPALRSGTLEALDALVTEPSFFFGSSMGAVPAVRYALERPERVRGVILCSPGGAITEEPDLPTFLRMFRTDDHQEALRFVDRLFARRTRLRHLIAWGLRKRFMRRELQAFLNTVTTADLLLSEHLRALRPPVLLIWGKKERILPESHFDYFRRNLPESTLLEEPEGCGHSPYFDRPGLIARSILGFIDRVST
jgi:pimeloyl-ACP methyl ester carboxylesterase